MTNLIPPQYRIFALLVILALVAGAAGAAGAKVATWKADAACAESKQKLQTQIDGLKDELADLDKAVSEANQALAVAEAETKAANRAKEIALLRASEQAAQSKTRLERLEAFYASAQSCGDVLSDYWESRR